MENPIAGKDVSVGGDGSTIESGNLTACLAHQQGGGGVIVQRQSILEKAVQPPAGDIGDR